VCHCSSSRSVTVNTASCRTSTVNSSWSGYRHRCWFIWTHTGIPPVLKTTASCFAALRQLRTVRRCLPLAAYKSLIVSLVLGLRQRDAVPPAWLPVPSSAVRQQCGGKIDLQSRWSDHVTPALMELHWLSAVDPVDFKVATLVFRCLHDLAPAYLSSSLHRAATNEATFF